MSVAGIILAAGAGTRFGRPKVGVTLDGITLAARAVDTARAGGCDPVILVIGPEAAPPTDADLVVVNGAWSTGMASSLAAGIGAAESVGADAVVVLLVDQPAVGAGAVDRLIEARRRGASLARATYGGRPDHPVLIGAEHWVGLAAELSGDEGARSYLRAHADEVDLIPCDGLGDPLDIDRPEDLAELTSRPTP